MTTQSNPQVWDPDSTYSINELINNRIKTNQQINLANFNALQFPQEEKFHYNNFKIEPKDFDKVLIDCKYNWSSVAIEARLLGSSFSDTSRWI